MTDVALEPALAARRRKRALTLAALAVLIVMAALAVHSWVVGANGAKLSLMFHASRLPL